MSTQRWLNEANDEILSLGTYTAGSKVEDRLLRSAEIYAEMARACAEDAKAKALGRIADAIEKFSRVE